MLQEPILIENVEYEIIGWPPQGRSVKTTFSRSQHPTEKYYARRKNRRGGVFIKKAVSPAQKAAIWREYTALRRLQPWSPLSWAVPRLVPRILHPLNEEGLISDTPLYLVTERLGIEPLAEKRFAPLLERVEERGLFSQQEWEQLVRTLFKALRYLHRRGVYHCDLTPEHIWVRPDCQSVRLVDFSLAFCQQENLSEYGGTDTYAAPEIYQGLTPSAGVSVYKPINEEYLDSFGAWAALYYARTGEHFPLEGYLWAVLDKSPISTSEKETEKRKLETWVQRKIQDDLHSDIAHDPLLRAMVQGLEAEASRRGGGWRG